MFWDETPTIQRSYDKFYVSIFEFSQSGSHLLLNIIEGISHMLISIFCRDILKQTFFYLGYWTFHLLTLVKIINNSYREGLKNKQTTMVGFIQRSSDPSQPGRALDNKKSKIHFFLCLYYLYNHQILRELWRKKLISASFKMFKTNMFKSKSPTYSRDFWPDPPSNEKLSSSLFWMN